GGGAGGGGAVERDPDLAGDGGAQAPAAAGLRHHAEHGAGGGGAVERDPDLAGDGGAQAPAAAGLRHHAEHGAGGGGAAGARPAGRAPERHAVAGDRAHHGGLDGLRLAGAAAGQRG